MTPPQPLQAARRSLASSAQSGGDLTVEASRVLGGDEGTARLLQSTAGPAAQTIAIASEYESLAAFEESRAAVVASPPFQAVQADTDPAGTIVAQAISTEIE